MTALGKRREYQQLIKNEIADVCSSKNVDVFSFHCFRFVQKIREMEQIDRQRSKALEQRLKREQQ